MRQAQTVLVPCTGTPCRAPIGEAMLAHDPAGRPTAGLFLVPAVRAALGR